MLHPRFSPALFVCALLAVPAAAHAQQKNSDAIEKCDAPYGTVAINEPDADAVRSLSRYKLGSPAALLRIMIQESNCFVVVERGSGLAQMQQERALAGSGQLQTGSNVGGGQMAAADFLLTPGVIFSDMNSGGIGGAAGGAAGRVLGVGGGGVKFNDAKTSLLVSSLRTGVQVAAAEGQARKTDFGWGAISRLGVGVGAAGYSSSNEGKIVAASFRDNYNNIVRTLRANPPQKTEAPAPAAVFNEGDVLRPKIDGVQVLRAPKDGSPLLATLRQHETMVFLGEESNGYLKVLATAGEGWVRKLVVTPSR
jgi:curli biogenesis system outer membrane secretion channel CsgG